MSRSSLHRSTYSAAGTLALLLATFAASKVTAQRESKPLDESLNTIPFEIGGFVGTDNHPLEDTILRELKATSFITRNYRKEGLSADLFIAFYAQQRAGESMHSPKHCLPGSGWEIWDYDTVVIPVADQRFTVNRYSIRHDNDRRQVLYWYQSRKRVFASEYLGKLLLAQDALLQNSTAAAIVRVILPDTPDALKAAPVFASAVISHMQRCFGG